MNNKLELNFEAMVDYDQFDSDQIQELKEIFKCSNQRLFLFLSNHPEIDSDCLWEILQFSNDTKNNSDAIVGQIIQVLGIYMDHIKEKGIPCCYERIKYGLYAVNSKLSYPYINYLMCTPTMDEKNIKDVYECFMSNITLTRITEAIPMYSVYTSEQVTQVCKALIEIQHGDYATDFLQVIKCPVNSAHNMLVIRREAKKIINSVLANCSPRHIRFPERQKYELPA